MVWTLQNIAASYHHERSSDRTGTRVFWSTLVTANAQDASAGYGFLQACWDAIRAIGRTGDTDDLLKWLDGEQGDAVLQHSQDIDQHNHLVFLAHLHCALEVAKCAKSAQPISASNILSIVKEIEQKAPSMGGLSVAYMRDLIAVLLAAQEGGRRGNDPAELCQQKLCEIQRNECISVLFVDEKEKKGYVGTLSLELVERDKELLEKEPVQTLYPTPLLSLIARDEAFHSAESNAREYVLRKMNDDGWPKNYDVRWNIRLQNCQPIPSILAGPSLGGAFALGLLKLLSGREM